MTLVKMITGQIGEDAAVDFIKKLGFRILERNFRSTFGEIDIIAQEDDTLCFIEVKTRNSDTFGSPLESITPIKQRKIIQVANSYLKLTNNIDRKARFDVISIILGGNKYCDIDIIKNAFDSN